MKKYIQRVRGMPDYLPEEVFLWQKIEFILKKNLCNYGYFEIRSPIVENSLLFMKSIGNITDIIQKEMYTFKDKNENYLSLRPEGTSGCVRSIIENKFLNNKYSKFWYYGPMFRYERPQKGRYRQFNQIGVEVFNQIDPIIEVELILINLRWWKILNIDKYISLEINSIGSLKSRLEYKKSLTNFFIKNKLHLNENFKFRVYNNPIRLLDSKDPLIQNLILNAPLLKNYLNIDSINHFNKLCNILDKLKIKYKINRKLVRGLDYYNNTVFEWVSNVFGYKKTLCGGGRYDCLFKNLGGKNTPAVGFAMGVERLIILIKLINYKKYFVKSNLDTCLISIGKNSGYFSLLFAEFLRNKLPLLRLMVHYSKSNIQKQLKFIIKYNIRFVLILGINEIKSKKIIIKDLITGKQKTYLQNIVHKKLKLLFFNIKK